jgi:hypothetical protein
VLETTPISPYGVMDIRILEILLIASIKGITQPFPSSALMSVKNELIQLGYANPELREHIRPVLAHVTEHLTKIAAPVEETMAGSLILGPARMVAQEMNRILGKHRLNPYMSSIVVEGKQLVMSILCEHEPNRQISDAEASEVGKEIATRISSLAYRGVSGDGFYSDISGGVHIVVRQNI